MTLKEGEEISGIKRGAFGEAFSIKDLKAAAKLNKTSVNDYMMAIVGVALNKYYVSKGESPGVITLSLPASFKGNAETAESL